MSDELTGYDKDLETGLDVFWWSGQKRYKCPLSWESGERCAYDTYDLSEMRKHISKAPHSLSGKLPTQTQRRTSSLLDGKGNPIIVEEIPTELQDVHFATEDDS